jgi:hypothetical protein
MTSGYIAFLKKSKRGVSEPGASVCEDRGDYSIGDETGDVLNAEKEG